MFQIMTAWLLEHGMICVQRSPNSKPFVARGGLNVCSPERGGIEQLAIGDAVEGTSASHCQIVELNSGVKTVQEMKEYLFKSVLYGKSQVHVTLNYLAVRLAGFAEQLLHAIREVTRQLHGAVGQDLHSLIAP